MGRKIGWPDVGSVDNHKLAQILQVSGEYRRWFNPLMATSRRMFLLWFLDGIILQFHNPTTPFVNMLRSLEVSVTENVDNNKKQKV